MSKFNKIHSAIVSTFKAAKVAADKLELTSVTKQNAEIQKLVDAHLVACTVPKAEYMKGNAKTNEAKGEIKALFEQLAKAEYISAKSATQYQTCFWIAFETGVPFARDLVNKKSAEKKSADKSATPKSGKVTSTSRTDLDKTLSKALAQARMLGLTEFAATMLDLCLESLDGFKETVLDK